MVMADTKLSAVLKEKETILTIPEIMEAMQKVTSPSSSFLATCNGCSQPSFLSCCCGFSLIVRFLMDTKDPAKGTKRSLKMRESLNLS